MLALLLTGMMAYLWNGLSPRALLCFDRTGLDPGEVGFGLPVAYGETWVRCLGPVGWIAGLGTFALAFTMVLIIYRWPLPLRAVVAAAPAAIIAYAEAYVWDHRPCVRPVLLQISMAQILLAVLAAVLCRPIARLLLRKVLPKWARMPFFAGLWSGLNAPTP